MKRGELVSNEEVLGLLERAMAYVDDSCKGFLIDGYRWQYYLLQWISFWYSTDRNKIKTFVNLFRYPRQKDQGAAFEKSIAPVDMILYFECKDVSNYVEL